MTLFIPYWVIPVLFSLTLIVYVYTPRVSISNYVSVSDTILKTLRRFYMHFLFFIWFAYGIAVWAIR